jgi:hypothetical protein
MLLPLPVQPATEAAAAAAAAETHPGCSQHILHSCSWLHHFMACCAVRQSTLKTITPFHAALPNKQLYQG